MTSARAHQCVLLRDGANGATARAPTRLLASYSIGVHLKAEGGTGVSQDMVPCAHRDSDPNTLDRGRDPLVEDAENKVLLVLRSREPDAGCWSVPGGRVELGESLEDAAVREAFEETGLHVAIEREVWSLDVSNGPDETFEIHDFLAHVVGGDLVAGDDAADVGWFGLQEMEDMPLTPDLVAYLTKHGVL